jgi:hypothetical protein
MDKYVSCIHSGQREAFGFLFGETKTQLCKKPTWKILVDQKHGHTSMKLKTVEVKKKFKKLI